MPPLNSATKIQKKFWPSLLLGLLSSIQVLTGCGGTSSMVSTSPANAVTTFAFFSTGALDGSNSLNVNSTPNIWLGKTDGSPAVPLTRFSNSGAVQPAFSPDGSKIAFVSTRGLDGSDVPNGAPNIWVMNGDGTGSVPLTRYTVSAVLVWSTAWSPDGKKLAFNSSGALDGSDALNTNSTVNIWAMNADGTGMVPLTRLNVNPTENFVWTNQQPVWSPDSSSVAFTSAGATSGANAINTNEIFNLWVAKADGSATTPLTTLSGTGVFQEDPTWSPDGTRIAFVAQRALDGSDAGSPTDSMNLWVINSNGSGATPITKFSPAPFSTSPSPFLAFPTWSPDGSKIAFFSDQALDGSQTLNVNATGNIWTVNPDGSGAIPVSRLTALSGNFLLPQVWSSDGKKIAFASDRAVDGSNGPNPSGGLNVWVLSSDGTSAVPLTKLTAGGAESGSPSVKR